MTAAVAFVERIKVSKGSLFLIGAVSSDKAQRIVGQYIIDYCAGTATKTKYNDASAIQFVYKGKVNYIVFAGGYNKNSQDFIQGDSYDGCYLTEINLLDKDFIAQAMDRVIASNDPFIFASFNPKGPRHWFYTEYLDIWESENDKFTNWLNYIHLTMSDNPAMTVDAIERAKAGKDPDSVFYKRNILGLRVDPEGNLYKVTSQNKLDTVSFDNYNRYVTVVDLGESSSSTTFLMGTPYFDKEKNQWQLHIIREWNHINNEVNEFQKKSPLQYIDDYVIFIKECIELMNGRHPDNVLFDGTDQFFRDLQSALREAELGQHTPKRVTKDKEEDRIYKGQS
jgi:PBSX family phage terminase large subunit